jgi:serpin B
MLRSVRLVVPVLVLGAVLLGCGDGGDSPPSADDGPPAEVELLSTAERVAPSGDPSLAGAAITAFGTDLLRATRDLGDGENVIVSPASVAIALAMLEPGAVDDAQTQLRDLLRITDPDAFHSSMNALEQDLEARTPGDFGTDSDPGELTIGIANAAYLERDYPFEPAYLEAIGTNYGPVLEAVDFRTDPDAVAHEINRFVADATHDRITDLVGDGVLDPDTVLALVNALYLHASWVDVFPADGTEDGPFTLADGTEIQVPLMHGAGGSSAAGDGWIGATKPYVGGLTAQFILPDEGRFDEVADRLGDVFDEFDANRTGGAELVVPRFETNFHVELPDALRALGLTAPFEEGHLLGIAPDRRLKVDQVIHQTFVAMDEAGTEAAAATIITVDAGSAPLADPVPVVLDRPFLFRILDDRTGATLFIGQVVDPS